MTMFLSRYPDGGAGVALLLLRLVGALVAFPVFARLAPPAFSPNFGAAAASLVALSFALGLGTRFSAPLLALLAIPAGFSAAGDPRLLILAQIGSCAALCLLGPGAYSIDARVFGRSVVRVEPRSPNRGSGG